MLRDPTLMWKKRICKNKAAKTKYATPGRYRKPAGISSRGALSMNLQMSNPTITMSPIKVIMTAFPANVKMDMLAFAQSTRFALGIAVTCVRVTR